MKPSVGCLSMACVIVAAASVGCGKSDASAQPAPKTEASTAPSAAASSASSAPSAPSAHHEHHEKVVIPAVTISDKATTTVHVTWDTPKGTAVNDDAPFRVRWTTSEGLAEVPPEVRGKGKDVSAGFDVPVVATKGTPEAMLAGNVEIVVCDSETHSVCVPVKRRLEMPFLVGHEAKARTESAKVPLPKAK